MLNPEPLQARWQRVALGPALLLALLIAGAGVLWLNQAKPASADPVEWYHYYEGTANVKVKNGNAYAVYPTTVCAVVVTQGENGNVLDAGIVGINFDALGSDLGEIPFDCDYFGPCDIECNPASVLDPGVQNAVPDFPVGTFMVDTYIDELLTGGTGWKTNPVKNTSSQWTFTMKKPEFEAGFVALNNNFRPLQGGTTLTVKFLRGRSGLYFKVAGTAPLNDNGTPKVTVEIETPISGLDAPPEMVSSVPGDSDAYESDTTMSVTFTEPVVVDEGGIAIFCPDYGEYPVDITGGQGTKTISFVPEVDLPGNVQCELYIDPDAIADVDTVDPPEFSFYGVSVWFWTQGPPP